MAGGCRVTALPRGPATLGLMKSLLVLLCLLLAACEGGREIDSADVPATSDDVYAEARALYAQRQQMRQQAEALR